MQEVHKLDGFPHCVDDAAAIEEQTVRRPERRSSQKKE